MVDAAQNSDNQESNSPQYQNTDTQYSIPNLTFHQENNYYPHPHDFITQSSVLKSLNQEHQHQTSFSNSMSSNVPVSPSFSVTSSSSAFSSLSLSSVSSPSSSSSTPTEQNYLCDSLLDEDILDVIAEWQDS